MDLSKSFAGTYAFNPDIFGVVFIMIGMFGGCKEWLERRSPSKREFLNEHFPGLLAHGEDVKFDYKGAIGGFRVIISVRGDAVGSFLRSQGLTPTTSVDQSMLLEMELESLFARGDRPDWLILDKTEYYLYSERPEQLIYVSSDETHMVVRMAGE